jgi:hypothetical protein
MPTRQSFRLLVARPLEDGCSRHALALGLWYGSYFCSEFWKARRCRLSASYTGLDAPARQSVRFEADGPHMPGVRYNPRAARAFSPRILFLSPAVISGSPMIWSGAGYSRPRMHSTHSFWE